MRHASASRIRLSLAILVSSLLISCGAGTGGGSSGSGDWYYHFACNGDAQCLSTNPTGASSGNLDEGPSEASCTSLMNFAARFWGPAAFNACDESPAFPLHLLSLVVSPSGSRLALGASGQFQAIAHYNDGSYRDVTTQAVWSIPSGGSYATTDSGGLVHAVALGTATVQATMGVISGSTTVTVGPVAIVTITVAPTDPTIAKGQTQAFTATGHYSDGSTANVTSSVTWSSAPTATATIAQTGVASGVRAGTATITASSGAISGSTTLTVTGPVLVTIVVDPAMPSVARTFSRALRAVGNFSDGTSEDLTGVVSWGSATPAVATIDPAGLVTGVSAGTSILTATVGAISGQTTVTVTNATLQTITVTPPVPSVAPGTTVAFTATGHFSDATSAPLPAAAWSSATPAAATIGATGIGAAVAAGSSIITAAVGPISGTATLTVTLTPPGTAFTYQPINPAVGTLTSVAWSGSQFVAVGNAGHVVTSPDGMTWTASPSGTAGMTLLSVAWSAPLGRFVAVGPAIFTSPDGITWTLDAAVPVNTSLLYDVIWSGTQFVAVGVSWPPGTGVILTSPDGLTWTSRTSATTASLRSVAWSGVQYVATGDATVISPDGKTWTKTATETVPWTSIAWSGSVFVRVSSWDNVQTSADGITWVDQATQPMGLYCVIWADTQFVAVGGASGSPGYVATSPDGITWTSRSVAPLGPPYDTSIQLDGVAWSGTRLVAVGYAGFGSWTSP